MPPAARLSDNHACTIEGDSPVVAPCCPTVMIGNLPAARMSDSTFCGLPIAKGSLSLGVHRELDGRADRGSGRLRRRDHLRLHRRDDRRITAPDHLAQRHDSALAFVLSKQRGDESTMAVRPVHWHEGMFFRPHHFQAAQRHTQYLTNLGEKWDHYYNWGLCAADIDLDALANHRLVVHGLRARLRNGSLVSIPEEGTLPALDLKAALEGNTNPMVYLAVPVANLKQANVASN